MADSFTDLNPDLTDLDIPAPGGFSKRDWSLVPHYCTRSLHDALIQRFARLIPHRASFRPTITREFLGLHHIHSAKIEGRVVKYEDLALEREALPARYPPGLYVADHIWPLPLGANTVSFVSSHGPEHLSLVVSPEVPIGDLGSTRLDPDDAGDTLRQMGIDIS